MKGDFTRFTFDRRKHYSGVRMQQGRVQLDADWNELGDIQNHRMEIESRDFIGSTGAPKSASGFAISVPGSGGAPTLSAGRMYVDGILCENEDTRKITEQPDFWGYELPASDGLYLFYLEVWKHHITALEEPALREITLGGPDTATRVKNVWQVKHLHIGEVGTAVDASTEIPAWDAEVTRSSGLLRAHVAPQGAPQIRTGLFRVEYHGKHPSSGRHLFKWSRNNGSTAARWKGLSGEELTIESQGSSSNLGFSVDQWVELTDDWRELERTAGTLARIQRVEEDALWLDGQNAIGAIALPDSARRPKVRAWDGIVEIEASAAGADTWEPLGAGVEIQVDLVGKECRPGDYWTVPAREIVGGIEWPDEGDGWSPPEGIELHYGQLAVVTREAGVFKDPKDRRFVFPSLTERREVDWPVGVVLPFATDEAPPGWLVCDGRSVSRDEFADLYRAIGDRFGAGDGATTFGLPDLRGEFIRGWDGGRGVDPGRSLGSSQQDQLQSHGHRESGGGHTHAIMWDAHGQPGGFGDYLTSYNAPHAGAHTSHPTVVTCSEFIEEWAPRYGGETRPRNIALLYCIKC